MNQLARYRKTRVRHVRPVKEDKTNTRLDQHLKTHCPPGLTECAPQESHPRCLIIAIPGRRLTSTTARKTLNPTITTPRNPLPKTLDHNGPSAPPAKTQTLDLTIGTETDHRDTTHRHRQDPTYHRHPKTQDGPSAPPTIGTPHDASSAPSAPPGPKTLDHRAPPGPRR